MDVVTGAAGFIGSNLAQRLLEHGERVVGIDCLTDYYDRSRKLQNVEQLLDHDRFTLEVLDCAHQDLFDVLDGATRVFHLAGQPGVRPSWGLSFHDYVERNVLATQKLAEACVAQGVDRFVYASSSSVYGDALTRPTPEAVAPRPMSPYGVTKLAAEHLCGVYGAAHALSFASLRLFTVYGPGQRPDMAFSRLVDAALQGLPFTLHDDGLQERDFTYVDDVVDAFIAAGDSTWTGIANVGGGAPVTMRDAIELVGELCGPLEIVQGGHQHGDVRNTYADISTARRVLAYEPKVPLAEGLGRMVQWAREREGMVAA